MNAKAIFFVLGCMLLFPVAALAQDDGPLEVVSLSVDVISGPEDGEERAYESYLAAPAPTDEETTYPGIVLLHSFNGLEEGYRTMTDNFAAQGFVVLAVGWQTFERSPTDDVMAQLMLDSVELLAERPDVDEERIGLTGFCAGGRYTMLFMPQVEPFMSGVAWYGFPNSGDIPPSAFVEQLEDPMLIIHGTADNPSPVGEIYDYAEALDIANAPFELKVYQGEPHGFMLIDGQLRTDEIANDAFAEMIDFFNRTLVVSETEEAATTG